MTVRHGLLAGSFLAATLAFGSVLSVAPAHAQPVQGLYVAGEGGASFNQDQRVRSSPNFPDGRDSYHTGATGIGSIGWGLGNGFRVEVEGDYRNNGLKNFGSAGVPSSHVGGRQQTYGVMANALFDLDIGKSWLFPYFGAGVGYAWQAMNASVTAPNFSQQIGGTFGNFAYQGIFGLAFPVPWVVGLSATAEYRFWTMLGPQSHGARSIGTVGGYDTTRAYGPAAGNRDTMTDFNHSLMLGLRYEFNPAPPPPPPAPEPAAPAPTQSRTYLVFFDWDQAVLTDRARAIVATAAQASTRTQTTRIEVDGYTDNSAAHPGPRGARYNMALSVRRAQAVQAELIRDGVPGTAIDVHGFGETHPLVATGPNTREPQNRRVEIILH
ncbi:OmpA/MotB domain protein [Gluconacetobacter diazotrophicus PA1 5]|uniref:Outer membrane protein n=1 Tax=Gluconacetobacter diazotrophicus (strain ATCC 49037 / DSM 5601 / CCUG 37298 / CIP 103539 / LMG 7603 / PAl5) TaxID=272568 RepID=A9GZP4_GLUDA|nr:OmpA family protein [Gluconacetobacter diazotrophicus]ACI51426.1 OmpA/MotB domain protein [Gluconacetobacter diazotrophicus PA1 5]TWB02465.1 outer membrane protein OmpA-like peptidoglycan-associated protein [Gluconacetobacter diazotrophicus]CAP53984.1 Outer membrane protein [Gluconacetobacter diazotrophicus PA1 5]